MYIFFSVYEKLQFDQAKVPKPYYYVVNYQIYIFNISILINFFFI